MKRILLASAALVVFGAATPSLAQTANGFVGVGVGGAEIDFDDGFDTFEDDGEIYRVDGSVAIPFAAGAAGVQLDGEYVRLEGGDDAEEADSIGGAAHVYADNDRGGFGAFVGVSDADDVTFYTVGGEVQADFDRASAQFQAGYGQFDDLDEVDFYAGRGEGRYFVNDNFRLDVNGGYSRVSLDFGDFGDLDADFVSYGAGAEYQFDRAPVSLFATYDKVEFEDEGLDLDVSTFFVGARFTFGGTLRERDRSGSRWASPNNLFGGRAGAGAVASLGALAGVVGGGEGDDDFDFD